METLDYDHEIFSAQNREADKSLAVRVFIQPMKDDAKSAEAGRPIFVDTEMIEIRVRGDRNNIVIRPAREDDRRRFRQIFEQFRTGAKANEGTPLAEWPIMSASMVEELKYMEFHTVEQVAAANDHACARMVGLSQLREKAKIFLEAAAGGAPVERLLQKQEELSALLAAATANNAALAAQLTETNERLQRLAAKVAGA